MATEHIEKYKEEIINICEKYLYEHDFKRELLSIHNYLVKIKLPKAELLIDISSEAKIPKKGINVRGSLDDSIKEILADEIKALYVKSSNSKKELESTLATKWYEQFHSIANEPYVDYQQFVKAVCDDYFKVHAKNLELTKEEENNFLHIEKIFKQLHENIG